MKKYMFVLLILAIACAFSVSTVMAADLEKYDFDGKFSMEMDKGLNFQKEELNENSVLFTAKNVGVMYIEDSQINDDFAQLFYKEYEAQGNELVGTDGNITIFQKDGMYVAATHTDGFIVLSMGPNKDKVVNSIKTLKFS